MIPDKYLARLKNLKVKLVEDEFVTHQIIMFYTVLEDGTISAEELGGSERKFANLAELEQYIKDEEAKGRELLQCDDVTDLWDDYK